MDCSPPDSSIHGIFQARVLEWGANAFSPMAVYIHLIREGGMVGQQAPCIGGDGTPGWLLSGIWPGSSR